MTKNKQPRVKTSAFQITRAYAIVLIMITMLMSVSIIAVVGSTLVVNTKNNSQQLMQSLKKSIINDNIDWEYWRETSGINTHNTFVQVTVSKGNKIEHQYLSKHTDQFLEENYHSWPILHDIQYRSGQGVYYHIVDYDHFTNSRKQTINRKYEIWLSLNRVLRLFLTIIEIIIAVCLITFLIGLRSISRLANKLNKPLSVLTKATSNIINTDELSHHEKLPVPDNPKEVQDLTREFNHLLKILNETVLRDRQFVSDASHELRTPLAGIRGHINLLRRRGEEHPEIIPESLKFIDEESLRMQHLVENLLALSRMNNAELEFKEFNLTDSVTEIYEMYQNQLSQNLELKAESGIMLTANQDSVRQILISLLSNAKKYSPHDSVVTIRLYKDIDNIMLEVDDQGSGISNDDKKLIFNRFFRSDDSRSQKIEGTGLGLAITQRLVELNNGKISVFDNQPRGTKFIVTFRKN